MTEDIDLSMLGLSPKFELEARELLSKARLEERELLVRATSGDSVAAAKLLSRYLDYKGAIDPTVQAAIEQGIRDVMSRVIAATTVPNRRPPEIQPLMYFGDKKRKTRTKDFPATELIALRVARDQMLTEEDAIAALTTIWEGLTIGKGATGERLPPTSWPRNFELVQEKLVTYVARMFQGAPAEVCDTYVRLSFGSTSWYPYDDPSQPIIYPAGW